MITENLDKQFLLLYLYCIGYNQTVDNGIVALRFLYLAYRSNQFQQHYN